MRCPGYLASSVTVVTSFLSTFLSKLPTAALKFKNVIKKQQLSFRDLTLDYMDDGFIWTHKGCVHCSFDAELLLQGFRVTLNQGVVSGSFVDVNLITLKVFERTEGV